MYEQGWQPPLWLAAGFAALALAGSIGYWLADRHEAPRGTLAIAPPSDRIEWRNLLRFRAAYWYTVALCVAFYSVIFPFRSTFSIKYFQHVHQLSLEEASTLNSYVFLAAAFATPVFGFVVDRIGRHGLLMAVGALMLPLSFVFLGTSIGGMGLPTVLLGIAFSLVPAVLWPAVARYVEPHQLGTAYGLMTMLQNLGLALANVIAGYINDSAGASASNPAGYEPMLWFFGLLMNVLEILDRERAAEWEDDGVERYAQRHRVPVRRAETEQVAPFDPIGRRRDGERASWRFMTIRQPVADRDLRGRARRIPPRATAGAASLAHTSSGRKRASDRPGTSRGAKR